MPDNLDKNPEALHVAEPKAKKPYTAPRLVIHGTVERITEASQNTGTNKDSSLTNPENRSR
jgi:hypothetical protein